MVGLFRDYDLVEFDYYMDWVVVVGGEEGGDWG